MKSVYGITNSGNLFVGELTEWLIEEVFIQSQCQMSIYYKYAPYGEKLLCYLMLMILSIGIHLKLVVLSYFDDCVYWYTSETLGKCLVDNLG